MLSQLRHPDAPGSEVLVNVQPGYLCSLEMGARCLQEEGVQNKPGLKGSHGPHLPCFNKLPLGETRGTPQLSEFLTYQKPWSRYWDDWAQSRGFPRCEGSGYDIYNFIAKGKDGFKPKWRGSTVLPSDET